MKIQLFFLFFTIGRIYASTAPELGADGVQSAWGSLVKNLTNLREGSWVQGSLDSGSYFFDDEKKAIRYAEELHLAGKNHTPHINDGREMRKLIGDKLRTHFFKEPKPVGKDHPYWGGVHIRQSCSLAYNLHSCSPYFRGQNYHTKYFRSSEGSEVDSPFLRLGNALTKMLLRTKNRRILFVGDSTMNQESAAWICGMARYFAVGVCKDRKGGGLCLTLDGIGEVSITLSSTYFPNGKHLNRTLTRYNDTAMLFISAYAHHNIYTSGNKTHGSGFLKEIWNDMITASQAWVRETEGLAMLLDSSRQHFSTVDGSFKETKVPEQCKMDKCFPCSRGKEKKKKEGLYEV